MTNPLLIPGFTIPFDRIQPEHVEPAITKLLGDAEARLAVFASDAGPRTYANTLERLDTLTEPLDLAMGIVRHLESVATTPALREVYNQVEPMTAAFYSRLPLHEGIWKTLQAFAETAEAKALTGTRKRYLDRTMSAFRRQGAALPKDKKSELERIDVELAAVTTKFGENVLDSTNAFELLIEREEDLAGLPPTAIGIGARQRQSKGNERLALHVAGARLFRRDDVPRQRRYARAPVSTPSAMRAAGARLTTGRCSSAFSNCAARRPHCSASPTSPTSSSTTAWRKTGARALGVSRGSEGQDRARASRARTRELLRLPPPVEGPGRAGARALGRRLLRREAARAL